MRVTPTAPATVSSAAIHAGSSTRTPSLAACLTRSRLATSMPAATRQPASHTPRKTGVLLKPSAAATRASPCGSVASLTPTACWGSISARSSERESEVVAGSIRPDGRLKLHAGITRLTGITMAAASREAARTRWRSAAECRRSNAQSTSPAPSITAERIVRPSNRVNGVRPWRSLRVLRCVRS